MTDTLTLTTPDDWHLHLRDHSMLAETVPATARCFQRAIIMPNLQPPIRTADDAAAYRQRILAATPGNSEFEPLMTLYLTDSTTPDMIHAAADAGIPGVKLYPAGATTNSAAAVTDLTRIYPALQALQERGMKLLIHGEVTDSQVDIFDREKVFIEKRLQPLVAQFPHLKIVLEHITTQDAAAFVQEAGDHLAATITPQHLLLNRNHLLAGGLRPHNYCLPILKRNTHQEALHRAVASGSSRFFLGTDSAPHTQQTKETACGCAGCYSAPAAIELYAQAFDRLGVLDQLEGFASHHGPDFYGLPRNAGRITLERRPWTVPEQVRLADGQAIVPFMAGETLSWQLVATG